MDIEDIIVGLEYEVDAPGTKSTEVWLVSSISQSKNGDYNISCRGSKTPYTRVFAPKSFKRIHKKMKDKVISSVIKVVGQVDDCDMNIEDIKYMPAQKRRGRKSAA